MEAEMTITLDKTQRKAVGNIIKAIASNEYDRKRLATLSGGAGYGKTATVESLASLLLEESDYTPFDFCFCAPTGKAAVVLNESISGVDKLSGIVEAQTIHRLLGFRGNSWDYGPFNRRTEKIIFVDESSMIGSVLMNRIVSSFGEDAFFIFVGDYRQLQPIDAGCPYLDIVKAKIPGVSNVLGICHRQRQGSLIANGCEEIVSGNAITYGQEGSHSLEGGIEDDLFLVQPETKEEILEFVASKVREWHNAGKDYAVLAPQHSGKVGISEANIYLQREVNQSEKAIKTKFCHIKEGDRVKQTKNDYDLNVFNGFIGTVKRLSQYGKRATIDFYGVEVEYTTQKQLNNLSLGYVTSIHSSQGSGYDYGVIIADKSHTFMWTRQLAYVSLSRFKKMCYVVGQRLTMSRAVRKDVSSSRNTFLSDELLKKVEE